MKHIVICHVNVNCDICVLDHNGFYLDKYGKSHIFYANYKNKPTSIRQAIAVVKKKYPNAIKLRSHYYTNRFLVDV